MARQYKLGNKTFIITSETLFHSFFKDSITLSLLLGLAYINYNYIGNTWYVGLFIVWIVIGFTALAFKEEITKEDILKELEE